MIEISVDKLTVWIKKGSNVLQGCQAIGKKIPRFCFHDKLLIAGNCRMCLVEIANLSKPQVSCALPLLPSLSIFTNTALVKKAQEYILEFILMNHPIDCPVCDQAGECELQEQSFNFGIDKGRFFFFKHYGIDTFWGSLVSAILRRCILCTRCTRYVHQIGGDNSLGTANRGSHSAISTYNPKIMETEVLGGVIELCPVCWY